jgi:PEP-CTERM motif
MAQARTSNQLRTINLGGARMPLLALLPLVAVGSRSIVQAATIPVSFEFGNLLLIDGAPSPANPAVPTVLSGTGSFNPFGAATVNSPGILTFGFSPSGAPQGAVSFQANFTLGVNGGLDTLIGTLLVDIAPNGNGIGAWTIQNGTGVFSGATGTLNSTGVGVPPAGPGQPPGNHIVGTGEVTAPGLNAIPEPSTIVLLGIGMSGLAGVAAIRQRRRS